MKHEETSEDRRGRKTHLAVEDIQIDKEIAALFPPLAPDELAQLEKSLLDEGCRDPLLVWKEKIILLDGHNRFRLCRQHNISFKTTLIDLPDRGTALAYIIRNQAGRRNLTPEATSYLRGKRYLAEKQSHGGDRTSGKATDQRDRLETADRLAKEYKVGPATIRRDARFAVAVDRVAENCGEKVKHLILSRDAGLTRGSVHRLSKLGAKEQEKFIQELQKTGKPPRRKPGKKKATITMPTEPRSLAKKLLEHLGSDETAKIIKALEEELKRHEAGPSGK